MELTAEQLLQSIWAALRRIEDNLSLPPAPFELPPINVEPPDLAEVVNAVTGLRPGPSAEEIATAIAATLTPTPNRDPVIEKIVEALEKLDFRMQAQQNFGGGQVSLAPDQAVEISNWDEMPQSGSGGTVEIANDEGNPIPVSGTVAVSGPVALDTGSLAALENITVTVGSAVEVNNDSGNPIPVSGTVSVGNFPASTEIANDSGNPVPVSGTVTVGNQPAQPLTDTQLRASAVPVTVGNFPASQPVTGPLTDTQLRASAVPVSVGNFPTTQRVRDDYQTGEILADQSGAGAVLTFTFASAVQLVVLESVGANLTSRANPFGGTPTASLGVPLRDSTPTYLPVETSTVRVFAPSGTTVHCYGLRRT